MTLRNVRTLFLSSLATPIVVTGCFLVIGDIPEGTGGAHAVDAAAGGGNAGSGGISGSSGSASGGGSGAGASAGDGGVGGTSGSAGTAGGAASGGSGGGSCMNPPCDCDGDGHDKLGCSQGSDDCDDTDPDAFPGQLGWFHEMRNDGSGFDYNCDGQEQREFSEIACGGLNNLLCTQQAVGFHQPAQPCGEPGSYGKCKWQNLSCVNDVTSSAKIVRCH